MKLTKENVYINLQGKTKEELTDLWEFLTSNKEKVLSCKEDFLNYSNGRYEALVFNDKKWCGDYVRDRTEVSIEQLKQIIKPMENKSFEELLNYAKSVDFNISALTTYINHVINHDHYTELEGDEPEDKACLFILKYKDIDLSLEQQLQKAEAEVKRLQSLIEEENKPKVGNWMKRRTKVFKVDNTHCLEQLKKDAELKKITNPELIKLLEQEIK